MNIQLDTSKFTASIVKLKAKSKVASQFSLLQIGNEIMRLSQMEVPHDKGTLQNSGDVVEQGEDVLVGYHCVAVGTKVLTDGLKWVNAEDLHIGDGIISVDEDREAYKKTRKLRQGQVLGNHISEAECVRVYTDRAVIDVTDNHPFLARNDRKKGYDWLPISGLKVGSEIKYLCEPWESEDGDTWIAGMFDGEGTIGYGKSRVYIYQNPGLLADRIEAELVARGYDVKIFRPKGRECITFYVNGYIETMELLGTVQPQRLINKWLEGLDIVSTGTKDNNHATIERIEKIGLTKICNLTTGPATFISNGLISHNTPYAHRLHEHPEYRFQKGRKGKYLTDPIIKNAEVLGLEYSKSLEKGLGNG